MTPPGALPLYLPDLLPTRALSAELTGARPLLDRIATDLALHDGAGAPQHHLVFGGPGRGKSAALALLAARIASDLSATWFPVPLHAGWPRASTLSGWWLAVLDALAQAVPPSLAAPLRDALSALPDAEGDRSHQALQLLRGCADTLDRRLVLLLDDADAVLGRLSAHQWALREVLSTEPRLALVGASATPMDLTIDYGAAFYDFFQTHELPPLTPAATLALAAHLARALGHDAAAQTLATQPRRAEAVFTLLTPTPRLAAAYVAELALAPAGDAATDVLRLLDRATPTCAARLRALPEQAQQVVEGLAAAWDPCTAADLAATLRLPVNTVSSQLSRLAHQGLVEKVPLPPGARLGFLLADRDLALWYLALSGGPLRQRLCALARALEHAEPTPDLPPPSDDLAVARLAPERRRAARLLSRRP